MKPYGCVAFDDTHLIIYLSLFRHYFYMLSPQLLIYLFTHRTTMDKKEEKDRNNLDLFSLYVCAISCRHKKT